MAIINDPEILPQLQQADDGQEPTLEEDDDDFSDINQEDEDPKVEVPPAEPAVAEINPRMRQSIKQEGYEELCTHVI